MEGVGDDMIYALLILSIMCILLGVLLQWDYWALCLGLFGLGVAVALQLYMYNGGG